MTLLLLAACDAEPASEDSSWRDSGSPDTADSADSGETGEINETGDSADSGGGDSEDTAPPTDADGDGHLAPWAGGDDCDDDDAWTYPSAEEWCDAKDHDCDGEALSEGVCAKEQALEAVGGARMTQPEPDRLTSTWLWPDLDGDERDEWAVGVAFYDEVNPNGIGGVGLIGGVVPGTDGVVTDYVSTFLFSDGTQSENQMFPVEDFDGDGFGDLVFTGWGHGGMLASAHVVLGPSSDWPAELYTPRDADAAWSHWQTDDGFGEGAAGGDVNGDGLSDVVVTMPLNDDASAVLILGRPDPASSDGSAQDETLLAATLPGETVFFTGDQDGDGSEDFVVATGVVWFSGSGVPIGEAADWGGVLLDETSNGACDDANSERPRIGDWTGDGVDDLVLGCGGLDRENRVGTLLLVDGAAVATAEAGTPTLDLAVGSWDLNLGDSAVWGTEVSGDLDGDGTPDLVMMDMHYYEDEGGLYRNRLLAVVSSDGPPAPYTDPLTRGWMIGSSLGGPEGSALLPGGMGDVDGDGSDDLSVTLFENELSSDYAEAWVVFGWDFPWQEAEYW